MFKIIENENKSFGVKEVDADGNTVRLMDQTFDSHNKASDFVQALDRGVSEEEATAQAEAGTATESTEAEGTQENTESEAGATEGSTEEGEKVEGENAGEGEQNTEAGTEAAA